MTWFPLLNSLIQYKCNSRIECNFNFYQRIEIWLTFDFYKQSALRSRKNVVLPSATDPSQKLKLEILWSRKQPILVSLVLFEENGRKSTHNFYFSVLQKKKKKNLTNPTFQKNVVLPSATDTGQTLKLEKKNIMVGKAPNVVQIGCFEEYGGKSTQNLYFWVR